ncbi:MAG: hypothetical protein HQK84_06145 [Nitrospinae bacterium]|nr:hypothetical protein [Nitrospinota bacterium]
MLKHFYVLLFLSSVFILDFVTPEKTAAEENKYIGMENCRECHTKLYKSFESIIRRGSEKPRRLPNSTKMLADLSSRKKYFEETKRAEGKTRYKTKEGDRATISEINIDWSKDYSKDTKCLKCHSTGHGTQSGYDPTNPKPQLSGVTCESCHGPGSKYVPYMEKAAEKYKREEALKFGMNDIHKDKGKKACEEACHSKNKDCPIIAAIDGYKFDWEKRRYKVHRPKRGSWPK